MRDRRTEGQGRRKKDMKDMKGEGHHLFEKNKSEKYIWSQNWSQFEWNDFVSRLCRVKSPLTINRSNQQIPSADYDTPPTLPLLSSISDQIFVQFLSKFESNFCPNSSPIFVQIRTRFLFRFLFKSEPNPNQIRTP